MDSNMKGELSELLTIDEIEEPKYKLPKFSIVLYIIAAVTAILHVIAANSEAFADFINQNISRWVRFLLAHVTNFIPFSLAEMLIIALPIIFIALCIFCVRRFSDTTRHMLVFVGIALSLLSIFYTLFFWSFGVGYNGAPLEDKLELERTQVSAEELIETAEILIEKTNETAQEIAFRQSGFSVMPYNIGELSDKLCEAYESAYEKYDFITPLTSRLKPVILSEPWSYTHITGVYTYFTGEANLNVAFPDYCLAYTAAHEMAHQRGIAPEDEANFVAFLVCLESDDPYIRYSGYVNMLEYVMNALYRADNKAYTELYRLIDNTVRREFAAYSDFFSKYRDSVASNVSDKVNDTYLKLNGTEGSVSYGLVVDIAVAYYKNTENR